MPMPFEYHAEVLSDLATGQGQDRTMLALTAGAALVVFLLLQAAFGSWLLAALAFALLPLALVGGLVGDLLAGGDLSIAAMLGLFLVLGVALRQITVLVGAYRDVASADPTTDRAALVVRVTRERIGSVLLTVLALGAVFLPAVVAGGNAGFETVYPMAAVVLGGLISSTLVVLLVLPTLYLRFAPARLGGPDQLWDPVRRDAGPAVTDSRLGEA
jgi:Cu/Ag efflux pump CusA